MSIELHQSVIDLQLEEVIDGVDEALIETIWHELNMQLSREKVRSVITEIALGFQDARVKTFVPILVHRRALARLRQELMEIVPTETIDLPSESFN